MDIKSYFEKHNDGTLQDKEWEQLAESLIQAKFDQETKTKWTQQLRETGVVRTPAVGMTLQSSKVRKFMAAASFLLIVAAAGWYLFLRMPLTSTQQLASNYLAQPFKLNPGSTRGEEATAENRGKAFETFSMKQYEKSLSYLQLIESTGNAKAIDYFQIGLCLMYKSEPDYSRALNAFNAAQKLDSTVYGDEINWFSGLCFLMKGDTKSAEISLKKVVESPSSRNREAAMELLEKIQ